MNEASLFLLDNSITAMWVVLGVLILRLALKKLSKRVSVLLWALPALRLLLPFSVKSVVSLLPREAVVSPQVVTAPMRQVTFDIPTVQSIVSQNTGSAAQTAKAGITLMQGASIVWAAGLAIMLLLCIFSTARLSGRLAEAVHMRGNVWLSDTVASPFVLGVFRPRIYLPFGLDSGARAHVLAHERMHIKHGDHYFKLLGYLLLTVYWFNPVLWPAYILFCRDMELACDERVIAGFDADEKKAYSMTLLGCSVKGVPPVFCPLAFGEVGVKERIKNVLSYKKPAVIVTAAAVLLCLAAALCLLTDPKEDTPAADDGASGVYLRMEEPTVYRLQVQQGEGVSDVYAHADGTPFELGELVHLELLDTLEGKQGFEVFARDKGGELVNYGAWSLELTAESRIELEWASQIAGPSPLEKPERTSQAAGPSLPEELEGEELERVKRLAVEELKVLKDMGILSAALELDGNILSCRLNSAEDQGGGPHTASSYYSLYNSGGKYDVALYLDIETGKIIRLSVQALAHEGDIPVEERRLTVDGTNTLLRFYANFDRIVPADMSIDRLYTLLNRYWGFGGYTLSGTVDEVYGYDTPIPAGGTLISELDGEPYVTAYFSSGQESIPMYITVTDIPDGANVDFGAAHPVG